MSYKDSLKAAMNELAKDPKVVFLGYGVKHGGKAAGTLADVPEAQRIETPVAENLMVGMAIGMSMAGLLPVVFIERCDFILNAMDAIVNHLDKAAAISKGEFMPAIILRVVVGNRSKPLYTGATHVQDFSDPIQKMVSFPVCKILNERYAPIYYKEAYERMTGDFPRSTMIVEYKDMM